MSLTLAVGCRLARSIPACAGEPIFLLRRMSAPSVCGLSPRVRGNHVRDARSCSRRSIPACAGEPLKRSGPARQSLHRSIPACAGEPSFRSAGISHTPSSGVYPRVCGGTYLLAKHGVWVYPRVCGGTVVWECWHSWVYPRVCGGTGPVLTDAPIPTVGLSPRVRGNLVWSARTVRSRSIPACAGEPPSGAIQHQVPLPTGVYPRVCGGTLPSMKARGQT